MRMSGVGALALAICMILSGSSAGLTFKANPTSLNKSGDVITVTWSGIQTPSKLDWLGIYVPSDSLDDNFIGYVLLSSSPTWERGNGSVHLPLVNMREPYQLRLFQGVLVNDSRMDEDGNPLPSTAIKLAVSENVEFKSYNEPTQVHLALTSKGDEVRIMFVTRDPLDGYILYGTDSDNLDLTVLTKSVTYDQSHMCDRPANTTLGWRSPGYIHDGVIGHLSPSQRYYYQVGSKEGGWSETFTFISPPSQGDETDALLFGDMGTAVPYKTFLWTQRPSAETLKWLQRDIEALGDKPTFISHIGDISYARGYSWLWDEFFHSIQPVAARVPYTVCIGNHEYDWPAQPWKPAWAAKLYGTDGGGECGVPYSLRFHMPGDSALQTGTNAPPTRNLYFSTTFGVVHFVYFSTETDFLPGSDQFKFIVQDLESVDRKKVPFVVVLGHRPMYTSNHEVKGAPLRARMIDHLEPVFVRNNVDLVLWGHVHKYERTCAISNFTCMGNTSRAPVHAVIGMGGQDWQPQWEPRSDHPDYPIFPQPGWSLYRSEEFGYVRLHASRDMLTMSYVGNGDGQVHDYLEIPARSSSSLSSREAFVAGSSRIKGSGMSGGTGGTGFLTGALWFGSGCLFSLILLSAYKRNNRDGNGDWKRLEMKPLES